MSGAKTLVSIDEYLHSSYEPDCDYVDGELEDRNVGEKDHSKMQAAFLLYFYQRRKQWGIFVIQETRMRVSATRFRVPDISVFLGPEPEEQVFTHPPFLCIEVLSPEDRVSRMQRRIDDYLNFGVPYVWVVDPKTLKAWIYTAEGVRDVRDGVLRTENPDIAVPLKDLVEE
ncbi:MAG TPA: Uma2 family endonuclease [Bryobacteraceae bacterium]|nr:Uma2 family endonuclease [Bryobacteraceae bacterium]